MKYLNAQAILPDALVKELQSYVQGGYIYVPVEQKQQKRWGEASGYRQELKQRNLLIKADYQSGMSMLFGKLFIKNELRGCHVQSFILYCFVRYQIVYKIFF